MGAKSEAKIILAVSVILNLGMLAVFKYTDWIISTINSILPVDIFIVIGV